MKTLTIDNGAIRLAVDEQGRLYELTRLSSGRNYAGGEPLWRLYYQKGQRFQNELVASSAAGRLECINETALRLSYDRLRSIDGDLAITLIITATLVGDEVRFDVDLANQSDVLIKELQCPLVGNCAITPDQALITTAYGGCRYPDAKRHVRDRFNATHHPYTNEDFGGLQVQNLYPGFTAACNCFVFAGDQEGLYFGSHDETFRNTIHLWRVLGDNLEAGFAKHLFLKPGEAARIEGFVLSPYSGSWHAAADKYSAWAHTWFKTLPKPQWIENFHGWQRLIMKHQNGEVLFPYDAMPRIFADGKQAGIDALFMFAWWPGGMDRMYPDYVPDPEMGGEQALRANIRKFQDQLGGSVILYASGRLLDRESDFFKQHGTRLAIKTRTGAEARDAYLFSNRSTYERLYGAVELTPVCLDCEEWVRVLEHIIDLAADYGCKGVFFDQLGLQEYPCFDPNHGHPVPYVTQTQGKRRVIERLRNHARARNPQMAFGVEVFADAVGQFFDFHHGLYHQNYITSEDYQAKGVKPRVAGFVDWMRYSFPEVIISDRDVRDEVDFERRVNLALMMGLIHDVEIYRCRRTIAQTPRYQEHLGRINALRDRWHDLLVRGTYRDTLGFKIDNPEAEARCFISGQRMAVVLTQSHLPEIEVSVTAPGYKLVATDGTGSFNFTGNKAQLKRHAVGVAIFER
jgi:hypothetical protein